MTVFSISPQLFFFIAFGAVFCTGAALTVVKVTGNLKITPRREVFKWIFVIYILLALAVSLFPVRYEVRLFAPTFHPAAFCLVPFESILRNLSVLGFSGLPAAFRLQSVGAYIGGNLLLLFPFGFLLPQLCKRARTLLPCFWGSLFISLCIKITQYIEASYRLAETRAIGVDDILLNVCGALFGFWLWRVLRRKYCGN